MISDIRSVVACTARSSDWGICQRIGGIVEGIAFRAVEPWDIRDHERPAVKNLLALSDCFLQIRQIRPMVAVTIRLPGSIECEHGAREIGAEGIVLPDKEARRERIGDEARPRITPQIERIDSQLCREKILLEGDNVSKRLRIKDGLRFLVVHGRVISLAAQIKDKRADVRQTRASGNRLNGFPPVPPHF